MSSQRQLRIGVFTLPDTDKLQQYSTALLSWCSVNTSTQFHTTHFLSVSVSVHRFCAYGVLFLPTGTTQPHRFCAYDVLSLPTGTTQPHTKKVSYIVYNISCVLVANLEFMNYAAKTCVSVSVSGSVNTPSVMHSHRHPVNYELL